MKVGKPRHSLCKKDITALIAEKDIVGYYLHVNSIPCVINSPFREDSHPSFGLNILDDGTVVYRDFATRDTGDIISLFTKLWQMTEYEVCLKFKNDLLSFNNDTKIIQCSIKPEVKVNKGKVDLKVKVRKWHKYDIEYWANYGVTLEALKWARVYPISHKFVIKNNKSYCFVADKYAYCYVEYKDNKTQLKVYQPYNTSGYKWQSAMDKSVWSLWTKLPEGGDNLIIASSLKDSLNLICNFHLPVVSLQGEGYLPKDTVMKELLSRFKNILVFYDNDYTNLANPGRNDSIKLCSKYNLKRIEIPEEYEAKDPSDLYKKYGKEKYLEILTPLIKEKLI